MKIAISTYKLLVSVMIFALFSACDHEADQEQIDGSVEVDLSFKDQDLTGEDLGQVDLDPVDSPSEEVPISAQLEGSCGPQYLFQLSSDEFSKTFRGFISGHEQSASCHPTPSTVREGALIELQIEQSGTYMLSVEHDSPVALEVADRCGAERSVTQCFVSEQGQNWVLMPLELSSETPTYLILNRLISSQREIQDFTLKLRPATDENIRLRTAQAVLSETSYNQADETQAETQAKLAVKVIGSGLAQSIKELELTLIDESGGERVLPRIARQELSRFITLGENFELVMSGLVNSSPEIKQVRVTLVDEEGIESEPIVADTEPPARLGAGTPCDELGLAVCAPPLQCAVTSIENQNSPKVCQVIHTPELNFAEVALDLDDVKLGVIVNGVHASLTEDSTLQLIMTLFKSDEDATPRILRLQVTPQLLSEGVFLIRETYSFFENLFDLYGAYDQRLLLQVIDERGQTSEALEVPLYTTQRCDIDSEVQVCGERTPCLSLACTLSCTPDEDEPSNNRRSSAIIVDDQELVSYERTICGSDHDYYQVSLNAQESLILSVTDFDRRSVIMEIELFDEQGHLLTSSLNYSLAWRNTLADERVTYFVKISTYHPLITTRYRLEIDRRDGVDCNSMWALSELLLDSPISSDNSISQQIFDGESSCGGGGPIDIYQFTAPYAGSFDVSARAQTSGVDLLMYARNTCSMLGAELACNDDYNGTRNSAFTLTLDQGQSVYVFVDSFRVSSGGSYTISITEQIQWTCDSHELLLNTPINGDNSVSRMVSERASCGGGGPTDTYLFTAPATGYFEFRATALTTNLDMLMYAHRDCARADSSDEIACNDDYNGSRNSAFTLSLTEGENLYLFVDSYNGRAGPYSIEVTTRNICPDRAEIEEIFINTPISSDNSDSLFLTTGGSCGGGGQTDLYSFTAPSTGRFDFNAVAADGQVDTVLYARSICSDTSASSELACNGHVTSLPQNSFFRLSLTQGEVVYLFVDSYNGSSTGQYSLSVTEVPRPCSSEDGLVINDDQYEPNNEPQRATPWLTASQLTTSDTLKSCGDADIYEVTVPPNAAIAATVRVIQGAIRRELRWMLLDQNFEQVSPLYLIRSRRTLDISNPSNEPMTYYLKVVEESEEEASYSLTFSEVTESCVDNLEPNNHLNQNTEWGFSEPGTYSESLSLCRGDSDLFTFELEPFQSLSVEINFDINADLEADLYSLEGVLVSSSRSSTSVESVTYTNESNDVAQLILDIYPYIPVGYVTYSMTVNLGVPPISLCADEDPYEPNNTLQEATSWQDALDFADGQSFKICRDLDIFEVIVAPDQTIVAHIGFEQDEGGLEVILLDQDQQQVSPLYSIDQTRDLPISNPTNEALHYYLQVREQNDQDANYSLFFTEVTSSCLDSREPNDNLNDATLWSGNQYGISTETLTICQGDHDLFLFDVEPGHHLSISVSTELDAGLFADLYTDQWELISHTSTNREDELASLELTYFNQAPDSVRLGLDLYSSINTGSADYEMTVTNDGTCEDDDRYDPNDSVSQATPATLTELIQASEVHLICEGSDDYYQVEVQPRELITVKISPVGASYQLRADLVNEANFSIADAIWEINGTTTMTLVNTSDQPENAYIMVSSSSQGYYPIRYQFELSRHMIDQCEDDLFEPNNNPFEATISAKSRTIHSNTPLMACLGSNDYYSITLQPGEGFTAIARFNPTLANLDLLVSGGGYRYQSSYSFTNSEEEVTHINQTATPIEILLEVNITHLHSEASSSPYSLDLIFTGGGEECEDQFEPNNNPYQLGEAITRYADTLSGQALKACTNDVDFYPIEINAGESVSMILAPSLINTFLTAELYENLYSDPIQRSQYDRGGVRVVQYTNQGLETKIVYLKVSLNSLFTIDNPEYADYEIELVFTDDPLCTPDQYAGYNSPMNAAPSALTEQTQSHEMTHCACDPSIYFEVIVPARSAIKLNTNITEDITSDYYSGYYYPSINLNLQSTEYLFREFDRYGNLTYIENLTFQDQTTILEIANDPAVRRNYLLNIDNGRPLCARDAYEPNGRQLATPHSVSSQIRRDELLTLCVNDIDTYQISLQPGESLQSALTDSPGVEMTLLKGTSYWEAQEVEFGVASFTYLNTSNQTETLYVDIEASDYTEEATYRLDNIISGP